MAFDLIKRVTTPENWSRGQDVGTVGQGPYGAGDIIGKALIGSAIAGAAAAAGWLWWRGRKPARHGGR